MNKKCALIGIMEAVLRVNQLDACELDENITDILQQHFLNIFKPFQSLFLHQFGPELKAFIRFLVWKFSLGDENSTFGQRMLNLSYGTGNSAHLSSLQRGGLFFSFVLVEWISERCDWFMKTRTLQYCTSAVKTLSLLNFVVFLIHGCYPTLKERIFKLKIVPTTPQSLRTVNHGYLTREILWHGFSEFVFFILPHINFFTLRNLARRLLNIKTSSDHSDVCSFCEGIPTLPHIADCGHLYCYYCLQANLQADTRFPCCTCSKQVITCTPACEIIS